MTSANMPAMLEGTEKSITRSSYLSDAPVKCWPRRKVSVNIGEGLAEVLETEWKPLAGARFESPSSRPCHGFDTKHIVVDGVSHQIYEVERAITVRGSVTSTAQDGSQRRAPRHFC